MPDLKTGDRVMVNISVGIVPGSEGLPDWQPGTVEQRLENGFYRVRLDQAIAGRDAEKDAAPEHLRPLNG